MLQAKFTPKKLKNKIMPNDLEQSLDDLSLSMRAEIDQNTNNQNPPENTTPPAGAPELTIAGDPPAATTPPAGTPAPEIVKPTTEEIIGDPEAWYNKQSAAETATTTTQAQPGQKAAEVDHVYEKYKTVLNDPQVQFLLDQRAAGKSLFEVQKEFQFVDYDNLPASELFKEKLQKFGASEEDVKEELEAFSQLKPWEQAEKVASLRDQGKNAQAQKMANLNQSAQQSQQQQIEFQQKIHSEVNQAIESLKGTEISNWKVSDDAINQAVPMVANGIHIPQWVKPDGSPNIQQILEDVIYLNNRSAIAKNDIKRATAFGAKSVAEEIVNGSKNLVTDTGSARQNTLSIEDETAAMDREDEKRYGRTG